jgi:hypothetical protein
MISNAVKSKLQNWIRMYFLVFCVDVSRLRMVNKKPSIIKQKFNRNKGTKTTNQLQRTDWSILAVRNEKNIIDIEEMKRADKIGFMIQLFSFKMFSKVESTMRMSVSIFLHQFSTSPNSFFIYNLIRFFRFNSSSLLWVTFNAVLKLSNNWIHCWLCLINWALFWLSCLTLASIFFWLTNASDTLNWRIFSNNVSLDEV